MEQQINPPRVRFSIRWKIILPFILLALVLGLGVVFLVNRQFGQADEVRFLRQLRDSGQQATDEVVRIEERLLEVQRTIANTEGVPEALALLQAERLRSIILQTMVNTDTDIAVILDREGTSLLAIRKRQPDAPVGDYTTLRGEGYYQDWPFVREILVGTGTSRDNIPEKQAGMQSIISGDSEYPVFFIGGPMIDEQGTVFGAVLVGRYLDNIVNDMAMVAGAHISIYNATSGDVLVTDFSENDLDVPTGMFIVPSLVDAARDPEADQEPYHTLQLAGNTYGEVLTPFIVRNGQLELGILGVSLLGGGESDIVAQQYQEQARSLILFGALALVLVVGTGMLVSFWVTRPLDEITHATTQVVSGNYDTVVPERGRDEFGALARTFNRMLTGIRDTTRYQSLLKQAPSLAIENEMRKTLAANDQILQGQTAKATLLHFEVRGLTSNGFNDQPTIVLEHLNAFLASVVEIINTHGGVVEEMSGQSVRAYFGVFPRQAPLPVSSLQATHAGMTLLDYLHEANEDRAAQGMAPLDLGIGIAAGWVVAGGVGALDRLQYAVLGDTVNIAQRILEATRAQRGGTLIISSETHHYLGSARDHFEFGRSGTLAMDDELGGIGVFEVQKRRQRLINDRTVETKILSDE
jgi:class 3 adenylate cyclase